MTREAGAPVVGIVLIFLNAEQFITEAVESVISQTFAEWELVLVDDGSSDQSVNIAKAYAARFGGKVRYVEHSGHANLGMSASRNRGVRETSAPFIAFIDADDVWTPNKLTDQMDLLVRYPDAGLVLGALLYWRSWSGGQGKDSLLLTAGKADALLAPPAAFLAADPVGFFPGAGVDFLARRAVFEGVGGFEEQFRGLYEDQAFFAKVFLNATIYISGKSWLKYRQHDLSCVSVADTQGAYAENSQRYFEWLSAYVARTGTPHLLRAVQRAKTPSLFRRIWTRLCRIAATRRHAFVD
jgi:glycosyltransferase involved in cell wall biosynthesis